MKKQIAIAFIFLIFIGCDSIENKVVDPFDSPFSVTKIEAPDSIIYAGPDTKMITSVLFSNSEAINTAWIKIGAMDGSVIISYHSELQKVSDNKYSASVEMDNEIPSTIYTIDYFYSTALQSEKKIASHNFKYNNMQNNLPPEISNPLFYYENSAPTLLDTISRGKNFILTLNVNDENGLADIDSVYTDLFNYQDSNNTVITRIELFDDGKADSGDEVAGDGIYTRVGFFPTYSSGNRKFVFLAKDRAGKSSNIISHNFVVVQ